MKVILYVLWIIVKADPGGYVIREDIYNTTRMTLEECVVEEIKMGTTKPRDNEIATYECREASETF